MKKWKEWLNESDTEDNKMLDSMIESFRKEYKRFQFDTIEQSIIDVKDNFNSQVTIDIIEKGLKTVSEKLGDDVFSFIVTENTVEALKPKVSLFNYMFNDLIHRHERWITESIYESNIDNKTSYIIKVFCKPMNVNVPICVWNGEEWQATHYYISKNSIFQYVKALNDSKNAMSLPVEVLKDLAY